MVLFQHFGLESSPIFKHFDISDLNYPIHLHRAFEILYVHKGQVQEQVDNRIYHVNPHQFIIVFPDQLHGFDMSPNTTATIILFSPEIVSAFSEQYKDHIADNPVIFDNVPPEFEHLDNIFGIKSFLYGLCNKVVEQTQLTLTKASSQLTTIYQIINYINDHYTESCTLKQIADSIGYDYVYLSKLFQKTINLSYTKYLNSFRISKARELLKNTSLPVTDIAFKVGYENLRTLNRNFKDVTGSTPAQYRKSSKVTKYDRAIQENYISG